MCKKIKSSKEEQKIQQKQEWRQNSAALKTSRLFWEQSKAPGQTIEQCKMELAKAKRKKAQDLSHNYYRMLAQRDFFLQKYKDKELNRARQLGMLRKRLQLFMISIKCDQILRRLFLNHKTAYQAYTIKQKQRLHIIKLKFKLRLLFKKRCRHPALKLIK